MEPIQESSRLRQLERALLVLEGLTYLHHTMYAVFRRNTQQIKDRAYYLWQEAGCPEGQDKFFWNQASNETEYSLRFHELVFEEKDLEQYNNSDYFVQKLECWDDLPIMNNVYTITHAALGFCSTPHENWLEEIEKFEKMLKDFNILDADKVFAEQTKGCSE